MISDELFLKFTRRRDAGGLNPGLDLGFGPEITERASDTGDMREDLYVLYAVAVGMKALRILEIGTNDGTSTLAFLKAASEIDGHVTSVDVCDVPVAEAVIDHFDLRSHWTFHKGSSHDVLKVLREEEKQYDLIFIDGDHTAEGAKEDLDDAAALLRQDGVLFMHDSWCCAISVDWDKPFGERATPGCAFTVLEMLTGEEWTGVTFPFGSNMGLFRRRKDVLGEMAKQLDAARAEGLIP